MAGTRRLLGVIAAFGLIAASEWLFGSAAQAQIAFVPGIGFVPSGATMTVTPAVTPDRRYVRLTVNAYFNANNGFTTYTAPLGAVGGGGGGNFAGMNGVLGGGGLGGGAGGGMRPGGGAGGGQGGPFFGDPYGLGGFGPVMARAPIAGPDGQGIGVEPAPWDPPMFTGADESPVVRAARPVRGQRPAARKPARRPSSTARRREALKQTRSAPASAQQP